MKPFISSTIGKLVDRPLVRLRVAKYTSFNLLGAGMQPTWKQIYPWIKTAVHNLESIDALLQQTVERIAEVYQADCLLWAGLESGVASPYVYGTVGAVRRCTLMFATSPLDSPKAIASGLQTISKNPDSDSDSDSDSSSIPVIDITTAQGAKVQRFRLRSLPRWLLEQQYNPQLLQLETGELIVPITTRGSNLAIEVQQGAMVTNTLQFVLQLSRPFNSNSANSFTPPLTPLLKDGKLTDAKLTDAKLTEGQQHGHESLQDILNNTSLANYLSDLSHLSESSPSCVSLNTTTVSSPRRVYAVSEQTPFQGWNEEELQSLEIAGSQLGLAYSALYWRQRLEQSRQQAGLIGRIARLLNSTLNPDEIVGRIVAELGYGIQCDRSILVDLRQDTVRVLAIWDHADRLLRPLEQHQVHRNYWQNVIEMFLQGGASYLEISLNQPDPDSLKDWLQEIGALSVLLVPLYIQEEFFGAVALLSYQQERTYLLDELQTVRQVTDQAAIALTNAQTYQNLKQNQEVLRLQNHSLRLEVMRDELTQLLNRRALERELEHLSVGTIWAIQPPFSVMVCDIDHFKQINDSYGHLIGDEVLYSLAQRLQHQLRRETPVYRYGGEEFVVVLPETCLESAIEVAERLRHIIRTNPVRTKNGLIQVTASFGVAQQNLKCDRSAWDILQRADQALYDAKRQGRDQVRSLAQPRQGR